MALLPLALLSLASCASQGGDFPSLAPRPIEQMGDTVPDRPTPAATPDAGLDAQIADFAKQLDAADQAFSPAAGKASNLVAAARNAGVGSTAWLDAQTALADLDGIRAESTAAMSALDELSIARASKLEPAYPGLESLHEKGEAQVSAESNTIAGLQKQLPGS
ncbi:MAG: hypothetical protein ACTHM8_11055 [Sphingomonas sp.]